MAGTMISDVSSDQLSSSTVSDLSIISGLSDVRRAPVLAPPPVDNQNAILAGVAAGASVN